MNSPTIVTAELETPQRLQLPFEPLPRFRQNTLEETPERADNRGKRIGIFIVAYNALTTLSTVLKRITPEVWRNVEQVVVFDDASQDATYELAVGIRAMTNLPKLRVLKHTKNLGYGGNQKAGYRYFVEQGFDIVVLLHGDGQYAPELLSHMYAPLVRGEADAVFGSRMMKDFGGPLKGGMPFYKYVGNRLLSAFENRALGLNLTEFHSGYRAYNVHALARVNLDKLTDDFHFDTEIIIKLHHQNFRILEVPIPTFYGDEICRVNGLKYAKAIVRAVNRYTETSRAVRSYPEYEEYFVPYAVKRSSYSAHYYASRLVGTAQRVLEIGCSDGSFGRELTGAGNTVIGVDCEPNVPGDAGYEKVAQADLERGLDPLSRITGDQFDRILLLDRLEHLREPRNLLEDCRRLLAARGKLIVSVPNAVNFTMRLMVLFGIFRYADRGIMDWSHLRFFTRKTIRALLEEYGYRITATHFTVVPLERLIPLRPTNPVLRMANMTLRAATAILPGLFAYEIVLVAER
ncbi:MAG: bifunctional glycosyltransferase/class I SAM-dependent methyltransferase [Acidobacteriota bacterium]|nr:bifunctional glycosyltransferase/class I SAM-dependent methyltransferase [Acidobacteriota bacterium]